MQYLLTILFLVNILVAKDFKVASYNVENLFDLNYDKTEYNEFIPNTNSNWNKSTYETKLNNTAKVINDLSVDIVGLVEIENKKALQDLLSKLKTYKYANFLKNPNSAIGVGIISKFPVLKTYTINTTKNDTYSRPILEADINIDGKILKVFINHWKSKKSPESSRIVYASSLQNRIKQLPKETDYIILGDLNSNYNEFETLRNNKKLNDTQGITGINHILNTIIDNNIVTKNKLLSSENLKYNLWLELPNNERFSEHFKGGANTPDNMIISKAMFDNQNISYKQNSFDVFKKSYFYKDGKILRWKMKNKQHMREGYSDHLPIYATFSTDNLYKADLEPTPKKTTNISSIYFQDELDKDAILRDIVVLFKHDKTTIIKQVADRAIVIYGENNLSVGNVYDIKIKDIGTFYGLTKIKDMSVVLDKGKFSNTKKLYLDANKVDIFSTKYTNDVIYNLLGFYSKGYIIFNDKKIKLYAKDKNILPKDNRIIRLNFGHLAIYNIKPQIIIYTKQDYNYVS